MRVKQKKGQTIVECHESMKAMMETIELLNLSIHKDEGILEMIAKEHGEDPASLTLQQIVDFMGEGKERMLAMQFLLGADERYADVLEKARLDYLTNKTNSFPKTVQDCFVLLKGFNPKRQPSGIINRSWEFHL